MSLGKDRVPEIDHYAGPGRVVIVLFLLLLAATVLLICGGSLVVLAGFVLESRQTAANAVPVPRKAVSKKNKAGTFILLDWKEAFGAPQMQVDEADRAAIERLFETLLPALESANVEGIRDCFDNERRFQEVAASRLWPRLTSSEWSEYKQSFTADSLLPQLSRRFRLVGITPTKGTDEVLVCGNFWYPGGVPIAMQWRLVRRGRWRVFDAAEYGSSMSYAKRDALRISLHYAADPAFGEYDRVTDAMAKSAEFLQKHDMAGATASLRGVSLALLPDELADELRHELAFAWARAGNMRQMIALAESIQNKQAVPGAYHALAWAYDQQGRHAEVLKALDNLERVRGNLAPVSTLRAAALEALDRPAEAASSWQTLLAADPQGLDALTGLARSLPSEKQASLREHLKSLPEPVQTCEELFAQSYRLGDLGAHELLAELIAELAPDSAAAERARGKVAQYHDKLEEAAACFARAAGKETDADVKQQIVHEYLGVMVELEQLAEAYKSGPDPELAFSYFVDLAGDEDYVIETKTWEALLAARRATHPNDPRVHLLAGRLLAEEEKFAEAEREFTAGLAQTTDDDLRYQLQYELNAAQVQLGRVLEAYAAAKEPSETFVSLAGQLHYHDPKNQLAPLIERHRSRFPNDTWLDYYSATVCVRNKDWEGADRLLARHEKNAKEVWEKQSARRERVNNLVQGFGAAEAYRRLGRNSETFQEIANQFRFRDDSPALEELIAAHRQVVPLDARLPYWEVAVQWKKLDYEGVLKAGRSITPVTWTLLPEHQASELRANLTRATLRLGRTGEALALAKTAPFAEDPFPTMLASAAAGNVAETTRLMRERDRRSYTSVTPHLDPDLGPLLAKPEFLPLREEFPPQVNTYNFAAENVVLLFQKPPLFDEERIRACLPREEQAAASIVASAEVSSDKSKSLVARFGNSLACLTQGEGRFAADIEKDAPSAADESLKRMVAGQDGWLYVSVETGRNVGREQTRLIAWRIAAAIAEAEGANCLAVYWPGNLHLAPADAQALARLRSGVDLPTVDDPRGNWFLNHETEHGTGHYRKTQQRSREFRAAWARRKPGQKFSVQMELALGLGKERVWFEVVRRKPNQYGSGELYARPVSDSQLRPDLKAGEPVVIYETQLADWREDE